MSNTSWGSADNVSLPAHLPDRASSQDLDAEAFEWNFNNLFTTSKHGGVFQKHKISFKFLVNIPLCPLEGASLNEPAQVSLLYLGDVEISEDATLAELKSQVRLLPAP